MENYENKFGPIRSTINDYPEIAGTKCIYRENI